LAFPKSRPGQKPSQAKGQAWLFLAWLGPASGFRPEPAHHYLCINIRELLIPLWRGQLKCDSNDDKDTWDWVKLIGDVWTQHGKLVAEATKYFPSSFHRPPQNPVEKISSGYKAAELGIVMGLRNPRVSAMG